MKTKHQYELDILRIIGCIGIILFHYTFRGYAANDMSKLYFPFLGEIFKYGYLGIYLFFVLSGYTAVLSANNKNFSKFICNRVLKLYPSFWIAVCITSVAAIIFGSSRYQIEIKQFLFNLTMIGAYTNPVDGAYWFIFVILKFYLIVSVMILFKLIKYQKYLAGVWLFLSVIMIFYSIPKIDFFLIPKYSTFLISGMIFYSARREGWDTYKYVIQFISFILSMYVAYDYTHSFNRYYSTELSLYIVFFIISVIYLFMYLSTINNRRILLPKFVITVSAGTYPLYLIHQHFGYMIFNNMGHLTSRYVILSGTFVFVMFLSIFIVRYIEPNINKIITGIFNIDRLNNYNNKSLLKLYSGDKRKNLVNPFGRMLGKEEK